MVGQLQGVAIPASVLERDVLAARVRDYSPRLLDELWPRARSCGSAPAPLGHDDGRVVLARRDQAALLLPRLGFDRAGDPPVTSDCTTTSGRCSAERGACFFRELTVGAGVGDQEMLEALWDLVWAGEVTNDAFAPVRATVAGGGRSAASGSGRSSGRFAGPAGPVSDRWPCSGRPAARAAGRWWRRAFRRPPTRRCPAVALAGVLLERHGVLTREAVRGEGIPGGFAGLYPVLRAMEESGRIRRGYFVAGLGGAQFALPGAVDRLRSVRQPAAGTARALVLAATDPANPFGLVLPWPVKGPQRAAGAYLVLVDGTPALYLERGGRGAGRPPRLRRGHGRRRRSTPWVAWSARAAGRAWPCSASPRSSSRGCGRPSSCPLPRG